MTSNRTTARFDLRRLAHDAMLQHGLLPEFSDAVLAETERIAGPASGARPEVRDLRKLLWASIDNDDSRDLDQLSVAEELADGEVRVMVAIADVDALVGKGSAIDGHARRNTTSVYTAAQIFPMLPERLSTDWTSLADGQDRLAVVMDMTVEADGAVSGAAVYRAFVHNHAQLAYPSVGAWLEGHGPLPDAAQAPEIEAQLKLQDAAAQRLRALRHERGALGLETIQARATFAGELITGLEEDRPNRAKQLIEDFMIAANGVIASFLEGKGFPSLRRVVRTPERWDRIVELATRYREHLPVEADSKALAEFLERRRRADPERFPDLSLAIVKLMGAGEYVVDPPGGEAPGHFGLAVRDYTHSTAPNRRYPDVITQRLVKAALAAAPPPYAVGELGGLAAHCTEQEDAANKVERRVQKSAAALLLEKRIGQYYDGIVTGASEKGTWVRIVEPPVEGKVVHGEHGLDVGDHVRVKLVGADVEQGFIDFARAQ